VVFNLRVGVVLMLWAVPVSAQTVSTVMDNGPSNNRIDLIFIGDGYTASQLDSIYAGHVQDELAYLFNGAYRNPFPRYEKFFNAHRVNVVSNESGADQPPNNIFRDTALDASYWWGGSVERCLYFDTSKANTAVNVALQGSGIDVDARLGVVNDSKYGGCGGSWAVYAGANSSATDIAVHELGHSLGALADEYWSGNDVFTGGEPSSVNLTTDPGLGKWDRWVGYNDAATNVGVIDYYEGGGYYAQGLYRPSVNSEMRALFRPFDAVSREKFITEFYQEVDPLDDWQENSVTLLDPTDVWVDTVDPAVINVEWLVDGSSVGLLGETLDLSTLSLSPGDYLLEARAYDAVLDHAFTGDALDWYRKTDTSALEQSVSWSVTISNTITGDFNGDGNYTCEDVDALVFEIVNQTGATQFDLTADGTIDNADLDAWLAEAGAANLPSGSAYLPGDADLDGTVDGADFLEWNDSKFTASAAWCKGDFDASGFIDGADFLVWNENKFQIADLAPVAVPEPTTAFLALVGLCCLRRLQPSLRNTADSP
jgi:hypothetical protein